MLQNISALSNVKLAVSKGFPNSATQAISKQHLVHQNLPPCTPSRGNRQQLFGQQTLPAHLFLCAQSLTKTGFPAALV